MKYSYITKGVCSKRIDIEVEGDTIRKVRFEDGCAGNLSGIAALVEGMKAQEVIDKLKGTKCRGNTSCPDQLAKALSEMLEANA